MPAFTTRRNSTARRQAEFEGTGLGLSLVKRIVEQHGGCIRALGRPGHGARFEIMLGMPTAQPAPPDEAGSWAIPPAALGPAAGFRVSL